MNCQPAHTRQATAHDAYFASRDLDLDFLFAETGDSDIGQPETVIQRRQAARTLITPDRLRLKQRLRWLGL